MKGTLYLVLTGFFLGTVGIWVKLIGTSVSPVLLTVFRALLAAVLILLLIIFSRELKTIETLRINRKNLVYFLLAGFFGVTIGFGFYMLSFYYIPVSNAVLLVYIYPLVTALLSWLFLKERITRWEMLAVLLVLSGVWLIYGSELGLQGNAFGNLMAILAGCGYSVFFVFIRHFEKKGMPYWKVTFWPIMIGGLILLLLLPVEPFVFLPAGMVPLFILGLGFFTFLGYVFYAKGLRTVRAHNAVIIVSLTEPLTAITLALLILSEPLPQHIILGGILIILANVLVGKERRKRKLKGEGRQIIGSPAFHRASR